MQTKLKTYQVVYETITSGDYVYIGYREAKNRDIVVAELTKGLMREFGDPRLFKIRSCKECHD